MNSGGIYLALFTDPEGDSCFSIYQISRIKMKKVTFCKLKMSLSRNCTLLTIYKHFGGFCQMHLTILMQNQHENNFLSTSNTDKPKFVAFLVFVCRNASFISLAQISSSDAILAPVAKQ